MTLYYPCRDAAYEVIKSADFKCSFYLIKEEAMNLMQDFLKTDNSTAALPFGEFLVSQKLLSHRELAEALKVQKESGGRLGEVLLRLNILRDEEVARNLAQHLSVEFFDFDDMSRINTAAARMIPEPIAKRFCMVAVGEADNKLTVAMADPFDVIAVDTVSMLTKRRVNTVIASPQKINRAIEIIYHGSDAEEQRLRDLVRIEDADDDILRDSLNEDTDDSEVDGEKAAMRPPVIRFVDLLLSQAVKRRASDIHIEPQERSMTIRMRIDGLLQDTVQPPAKMRAAVVTRIKIISDMDIAERRIPQDGRFKFKASGRDIDVRVSSIPTIYGEKIVMRILDASAVEHNIDRIGFDPKRLAEFKKVLSQPNGIVVVTGPTGSGKTTTLYSALNYIKDPTKNIITVEDPVEYRLAGINQIQVKPEINLDFSKCLRAILRQDPDKIFIGEIRDRETVEIAIKASLTGHLVLSTFHTNDAPSAISRFVYMGIEPYLLASTLKLIIAQRLVRRICEKCKQPVTIDGDILRCLQIDPVQAAQSVFYKGRGCASCDGTGYKGRLPIFEFLPIDNDMRETIVKCRNESEIKSLARSKGCFGLLESGVGRVLQGITTTEEVLGTVSLDI